MTDKLELCHVGVDEESAKTLEALARCQGVIVRRVGLNVYVKAPIRIALEFLPVEES